MSCDRSTVCACAGIVTLSERGLMMGVGCGCVGRFVQICVVRSSVGVNTGLCSFQFFVT